MNHMVMHIIASKNNWIESSAVEQLSKTALLDGMRATVGMPDLHPGKDSPIGAVFAAEKIIYPSLVGNDIGCGMALWATELQFRKTKIDKLVKKLENLKTVSESAAREHLDTLGVSHTPFDKMLGTLGGGNHFAELQRVDRIIDPQFFKDRGLDKEALYLLVHSGSRSFGEDIYKSHTARFGEAGLREGCEDADLYLKQHEHAKFWAQANRSLIAFNFLATIGTVASPVLDVCHNYVQKGMIGETPCWLHRKGAAPADGGPVVIPGSRGTLSYLVIATGDQEQNLATLAHGAGRKWKRSECRGRLEKKYSRESLLRTDFGGYVLCSDKHLLYEEAPQAYKDIDVVVQDLVDAGLVRIIATFMPLITYKTRAMKR